ncbi:MAG TPA: response regulator [Chitinophagales bacterium]|nr:response regulator [Chitinophagales bacterium]
MRNYKEALIIDDDVDLCLTLKSVLHSTIPTIHTANTLAAGSQLILELKPEIVFLDNNLPDGQGINLIRFIKEQSPLSFIIFITAADNAKDDAIYKGVDVFLEKPLTYSSILNAISSLDKIHEEI